MAQRLLGGRYQVEETLGRGGMATVWRGRDLRLDRPVAIKMLDGTGLADPGRLERFDREARTVARLAHPNIVAVYDFGDEDGVAYLVMELVEGDSLAAMLAGGPLDVRQAVAIAMQTCDALIAAHDAGVVHRDVKPGNILVTAAGLVKICDFGIARLQQAATHTSLTGPVVLGTSEYMAPEQAAGGTVDARTDLYALGCVLYAMLTGTPPFTGDSPLGVVSQHLHTPPVPVSARRPGVPADLDALVTDLLAKNPADRPADARAVRARLAALSGSTATLGAPAAGPVADPAGPARVAAAAPTRTARATAAVVSPTRAMPAVEVGEDDRGPAAARGGFRLGPVGIAVVALVAALVAGVMVAALLTDRPSQLQAGPAATPTASIAPNSPSPVTPADPRDLVAALQADILQQVQADRLDSDAADDLTNKLDEIARRLDRGQAEKAAERIADLRDNLTELRKDGRISEEAYASMLSSLDQLAEGLPSTSQNGD